MRHANRALTTGSRVAAFVVLSLCVSPAAFAQYYAISTVAGNPLAVGDGGQATAAQLFGPNALAVDGKGSLFIVDTDGLRVRRVNPDGVITTVAGGRGFTGFGGDGGPATSAQLGYMYGVAVDSSGNLYIADSSNYRIRRVTPAGVISTVAGTGSYGFGGDGGPATRAALSYPYGVALDGAGNLYIADTNNHRIRRVTPAGVISTVAGNGTPGFTSDGGPATAAQLNYPYSVAVDSGGVLYIADTFNHRIRRVTPDGVISTIAGTGSGGYNGDNTPATSAKLLYPFGLALDTAGNVYISDQCNHRVRRVTPAGVIMAVAGDGNLGFSGDGSQAVFAQLDYPAGLALDALGNLYIADWGNRRVRQVTPNGLITTVAGGANPGDGGPATAAPIYDPRGVTTDAAGNLYIADLGDYRVRRVTPAGVITTIAGTGVGFSGDGGPATAAKLNTPTAIVFDRAGNLYVSDYYNRRIRQVTAAGTIKTVAGNGNCCYGGDGGPATAAMLYGANGMAFDAAGNLYFTDAGNARIRRVTPAGFISTVVGTGTAGFAGDGGQAIAALINSPSGLAFDAAGNLYFTDSNNHRIRRVGSDGFISTVVGTGTAGFSGDGGLAAAARLYTPWGLTFDTLGNLYIGDLNNLRVRRVATDGIITSIAGTGSQDYGGDGGPALLAPLRSPGDVALDASGNVFVADRGHHAVRKLTPSSCTYTISPTSSGTLGDSAVTGLRVNVSAPLGCAWTASSTATWITITSAASGNGDGIISYSVAANTGTSSRTGTIGIAGQTFTVTQNPPGACSYTLSPTSQDFTAAAATGSVTVTAAAGCAWTAVSSVTWITITAGASANGNGTVSFSVQANATGTPRTATLTIAGQAFPISQAANTAPSFIAAGITNGASFAGGLTPGSIVTIFGTRLTKDVTGIVLADSLPLPTQLAGTSVTIGGVPAPLFAVANVDGNEQINLQVPYEAAGQGSVNVVVKSPVASSPPVQVYVLPAHPGIFTVDGKAGAILHGADNSLVTVLNPAKRGEVVVIYATGLGPVSPRPATGAAAPGAEPLARTTITPAATVAGKTSAVLFSGLAPGFAGLYQVNIRIPSDAGTGSLPVLITVSNLTSNSVTMAVAGP